MNKDKTYLMDLLKGFLPHVAQPIFPITFFKIFKLISIPASDSSAMQSFLPFLSFILIFILAGCGISEEDFLKMATKEYERKVELLKKEETLKCYHGALVIAEQQVDSIIYQKRISPLDDTLYRPPVPLKPDFVLTDSTVINSKQTVKPIIERDNQY